MKGKFSRLTFLLAMASLGFAADTKDFYFSFFFYSLAKVFFLGRRDILGYVAGRTEWIRGVAGWLSAPGQTDLLFCYSGNDEYPRIYGAFLCTCSSMLSHLLSHLNLMREKLSYRSREPLPVSFDALAMQHFLV